MTLLSEILTNVRSNLDESLPRFYTDAELTVWVNAAIKDIARRTELYGATATVSLVNGTQSYVCPTDMIRINRVEVEVAGDSRTYPLEFRDNNAMDEVWATNQKTRNGTPCYFTLWGSPPSLGIKLWPVPQSAGTMTIYYYKQPAETTSPSATIPLPMGWDDAVVDFCEYKALRKARDARWQEAKTLYEEKVGELHDKTVGYTDQPGVIVSGAGMGGIPAWLAGDDGWW